MELQEDDITARSVTNLKEQIWVLLLKTQADIDQYAERTKFTQDEAAYLAGCGVQTIKDAISKGRLKVGSAGWITRPNLTAWLGHDPINHRIDQLIEYQRQSIEFARKVESLFGQTISDHLNPSIPVSDIEPAA